MAVDTPNGDGQGTSTDAARSADGLTPPTMKTAPESEKTQIGPTPTPISGVNFPTRTTPDSSKSISRGSSPTITGDRSMDTVISDIPQQDLSTERLLKDAPRVEINGKSVPSLNRIPLLAKIGQGGMGAVFYGVHPRLRSEVAVKVLPFHLAEQDPGMIRRFFREAQIAAAVHSPHLVNVMDVNEESGLFFLVMEYVSGKTAGQLLKAAIERGESGFPEIETLDICIAACEGLNAAHLQGIIHRDLKPDNIMVPYLSRAEKTYDYKRAKLMDLGLARSEESGGQSLTGVQSAMGTPGYMAPEQALDAKTADKRSDVFGMGATLYALLAGKSPFRGEAVMKVLMATMHEPHEPVIKVRSEISNTLSEIVDKCLDKKQENRFQDAAQLMRALKNCRRLLTKGMGDEDDGGIDVPAMTAGQRAIAKTIVGTPGVAAEATLISGASGVTGSAASVPGMTAAGILAPAAQSKKKAVVFAVVAAAVLVLAFFAFSMLGKGGSGGPPPGKTGPGTTAAHTDTDLSSKYGPEGLKIFRDDHAAKIKMAKAHALAGDMINATSTLDQAKKNPAHDAVMEKAENEVAALIKDAQKKEDFQALLLQVDAKIKARDLSAAQSALLEAKVKLPGGDEPKQELEKKETNLVILQQSSSKKEAFQAILKKAAALTDAQVDALELQKLEGALKQTPSENELKLLQALAPWLIPAQDEYQAQHKRFSAAIQRNTDEAAYKQFLADASDTTDIQKKVGLLESAAQLMPDREEARTLLASAKAKLGETERAKLDAQRNAARQAKFKAAYDEALACQAASPEKALEAVNRALSINAEDALAKDLKSKMQSVIAENEAKAKFTRLITAANNILDNDGELAQAEAKLAEARKLFEKAPDIAVLDKRITETKNELKRQELYTDYANKARASVREDNVASAQKYYDEALKLDGKAPGLDGVYAYLEAAKKKALAMQSKQAQYNSLMAEASRYEASGESRTQAAEQVKDYEKAVSAYADARNFAPDKDTTVEQKLAVTQRKLDAAKAKVLDAKRAADRLASQERTRQQFTLKLAEADNLAAKGQFAEASTALKSIQGQLDDKTAFQAELKTASGRLAEYEQGALRAAFNNKLAEAESRAAANPQNALALAQAARALLKDPEAFKTELAAVDARISAYNKAIASSTEKQDAAAAAALRRGLSEKARNRDYSAALKDAARAPENVRARLSRTVDCLEAMKLLDDASAATTARLKKIDQNSKAKSAPERAKVGEWMAQVQTALSQGCRALEAPDMPEIDGTAASLQTTAANFQSVKECLDKLESMKKSRDDDDDDPPNEVAPQKQQPKTPPKKSGGSVGEMTPDD